MPKILLATGADPNDLLVREGPEILRGFLNCVQPLTETTTASVLNAENTSRCFEVYLDESEQQTGRIHQRQRDPRSVTRLRLADRQRILERHHNAQRLLDP